MALDQKQVADLKDLGPRLRASFASNGGWEWCDDIIPALIAEVERLRRLMPEVYRDGYQAGDDGDESDVLDVKHRLDEYLATLQTT
jgi:hypothetical protein